MTQNLQAGRRRRAVLPALLCTATLAMVLAGCAQGGGSDRDLARSEYCLEQGYPEESPQYEQCLRHQDGDDDEEYGGGY